VFLADVLGTVVSPVQIKILDGHKLLLVRPIDPAGNASGRVRVAIDLAGAGEGDRVLVVDEGNAGRQLLGDPQGAVKTVVVGFVDAIELEGRIAYDHRTAPPLARRDSTAPPLARRAATPATRERKEQG
jgi:ethanolamine utilization protein EutN